MNGLKSADNPPVGEAGEFRPEKPVAGQDDYQTLVEALRVGVYRSTVEAGGRFLYANPAMAEIFGVVSAQELSTRPVAELYVDPRARDSLVADLQREGMVKYREIRLRRWDGKPFLASITASLNRDDEGRVRWIEGIIEDITARRRLEEEFREGESRYRIIFNAASNALVVMDPAGRISEANQAAADTFGYSYREFQRLSGPDLLAPEHRADFDGLAAVLGSGRPVLVESLAQTRDGRTFHAEIAGRSLTLFGRRHLLADIRDVSELRDLDQARTLFQSVFMFHPYPLILVRRETGGVLAVNAAFEREWGFQASQVLSQSIQRLFARPELSDQMLTRLGNDGRLIEFQTRGCKGDGTEVPCALSVEPIELNGHPVLIVTLIDLSERHHLEEQLRQSQKMEAVGRLAGGIAHDFNNFLAVINGYTRMILDRLEPESPLVGDLETIDRAGRRAAGLTRQLLAFSRCQFLEPRILSLNEILTNIEDMLARLIGEDIELITELDPELACVQADPGQIEQVVVNLAVNARDAMPEGGRLIIRSRNIVRDPSDPGDQGRIDPGEYVLLSVADTGVGMDEKTRLRLFEPFFTTKEKGKGTGLGLSTVYGIIRQSEGHITVESAPGRGSVFQILLPARADQAAPPPQKSQPVGDVFGTETILLVEDEDLVRDYARRALELFGYRVLEAAAGDEALELYQREGEGIDLLLADVVMPRLSGPDLARRLQRIRPELKTIFMSGYDSRSTQTLRELGEAFIAKPFSPQELGQKVREVLDG